MVSSPISAALPAPRAGLSSAAAFALLASLAVSFLAGSSAPTPLYAAYQARWGFSPIMTTVAFGAYALAVLGSLLSLGRLSDHIGRRPVLLVAVSMQVLGMLLFATASGISSLIIARIVQGLSTGGALGAIGAGLVDLDRTRGTLAGSVAPMIGTAAGGIGSSLLVEYLPAPAQLVYAVLGAVFAAQALGVWLMPEPARVRPGALVSLKPQIGLPSELRASLLVAAPLLIASWAFVGFYGSLGPALLRRSFGHGSVLLGGMTLFSMAGSGALAVLLLRARAGRAMMVVGSAALVSGVSLTLLAIRLGSTPAFFVGTSLAGTGFGAGFQGAIRDLVPSAPVDARAGVLSVIFVISYLAMGVPAIAAGFRVAATHDLLRTAQEFSALVGLLALGALLARLRR
jgi:MFS family permease